MNKIYSEIEKIKDNIFDVIQKLGLEENFPHVSLIFDDYDDFIMEFFLETALDGYKNFFDIILEDSDVTDWTPNKREKDILFALEESYISLYTCTGISEDSVTLHDELGNFSIECKGSPVEYKEKSFIRLINLDGEYYCFSGPYIFLDEKEYAIIESDYIVPDNSELPEEYLKRQSGDLLLSLIGYHELKGVDASTSKLYIEMQKFVNYLNLPMQITNPMELALVEFYDARLSDENLSIKDVDKVDFEEFFNEALTTKMIRTKKELNLFLDALKNYLEYLTKQDKKYRQRYNQLLKLSENRFMIMEKYSLPNELFPTDINFLNKLEPISNLRFPGIELDFEDLIVYFTKNNAELTAKGNLKRAELLQINDFIFYQQNIIIGNGNQSDFPLIDFLVKFGIEYNIFEKRSKHLKASPLAISWMRLTRMEKVYILANYLLCGGYWETLENKKFKEDLSIMQALVFEFVKTMPVGDYSFFELAKDEKYKYMISDPFTLVLFEGLGIITITTEDDGETYVHLDDYSKEFLNSFIGNGYSKNNIVKLKNK